MIQAHVHKQSNLDDFILDKSFTPRSTPDLYLPRKHNVKNYDVQPKYFICQKIISFYKRSYILQNNLTPVPNVKTVTLYAGTEMYVCLTFVCINLG